MDERSLTLIHKQIQKITYLFEKLDARLRELQILMETGKPEKDASGSLKFVPGEVLLKFN
jgi:hypothetical protein